MLFNTNFNYKKRKLLENKSSNCSKINNYLPDSMLLKNQFQVLQKYENV